MDEKEYIEKIIKLELHVKADLIYLFVIPRNESLLKLCNSDNNKKLLKMQSKSSLENIIQHIPSYEKELQNLSTFDIDSFYNFDLLKTEITKLESGIIEIKTLYDENFLYLKKEWNPEIQTAMESMKKTVTALTELVGHVAKKNLKKNKTFSFCELY